jgi:rod shape-determining protein MreC
LAKRPTFRFERLAAALLFLAGAVFILSLNSRSNPLVEHIKYSIGRPFSPLVRAVKSSGRSWSEFREKHRDVAEVYRRNDHLTSELERLKGQLADYQRMGRENKELRQLLGYKEKAGERLSLAYVLGHDTSFWQQALVIDVGAAQGVKQGEVCLSQGNIVGKVVKVYHGYSLVMLVTDNASRVSVVCARSGVRGIASGAGPDAISLVYLSFDADIRIGDIILSNGLGGVFPRGYVLGSVSEVVRSEDRLGSQVTLRPKLDLGELEHVFLLGDFKRRRGHE